LYGNAVYDQMHTVIETPAFLASAADEGVADDEREAIISFSRTRQGQERYRVITF